MILGLDDGTATVIVATVTGLFGLLSALLVQSRKTYREVKAVNKAVNNVPEGKPTLIQRVERLEQRQDAQTRWLVDALQLFGQQLGVEVPPHPDHGEEAA